MELKETIVRFTNENSKVALCVPRDDEEAIIQYIKWMSDSDSLRMIGSQKRISNVETVKKYLEFQNNDTWIFNMVLKENNVLLGNCDITRLSNTAASLGIYIGTKEYRNQGYGKEVIKLLLKYCFEELGMHRVELTVNSENEIAKHCYSACGFKKCGTEREVSWFAGKWHDIDRMDILDREYFEVKRSVS